MFRAEEIKPLLQEFEDFVFQKVHHLLRGLLPMGEGRDLLSGFLVSEINKVAKDYRRKYAADVVFSP